ncbi:hypothetical protein FisN_5Lu021 [Fistulifera solaris]|uniref:Uncharacterized protein n=1 Tax=Fistulifera solaris TaxID=1519565 RepID=A0A1Z5JJ89_FISSO|nr:hypothetical protein FisN_5Lu021 [Fistulifera solaris]|eukprot:GAX14059.1 hypothetical protein FisN_5Lu021 [Fistulifera solaris]
MIYKRTGTVQQIQAVIDSHIIFPLIQLLSSAEFGERKQAAYAISNAIGGGNQQQILFIVNEGCMRPLCDLLTVADDQVVMMTLDSLEKVLMVGDEEPRRLLIAAQGLSKMKRLQMTSCNDIISKKAHEIMLMYFESEVEEVSEDELIAEMERERNFTGNVDVEDTVIEPFQDVEEASLDGYNEPAIPHRAGRKPRERTEATIEYVRNPNYLDREIRLGCPHCHRAMFIPFKFYCDPEDEGFYDPDRDPRLFQEHGMYSQCLDVELPSKRSYYFLYYANALQPGSNQNQAKLITEIQRQVNPVKCILIDQRNKLRHDIHHRADNSLWEISEIDITRPPQVKTTFT